MNAQPQWAPTDDATSSLLTLVANDEMHPRPAEEWDTFVAALRRAADAEGIVRPNRLRPLLRGEVAPRRVGAFTHRAKSQGLLEDTGQWELSDDTEGRNAGRPARIYRLAAP